MAWDLPLHKEMISVAMVPRLPLDHQQRLSRWADPLLNILLR
jgi:hypothetical protein